MKDSMTRLTAALAATCALGLVFSLVAISRNQAAFDIRGAAHVKEASPGWRDTNTAGFRPIKLPYFLEDGYFRVEFTSDVAHLDLDLFAQDCAMKAFIDGKQVYKRTERCRSCSIFSPSPDRRCPLIPISVDLDPSAVHVLAVMTRNKEGKDVPNRRDGKLFWVQHESGAFFPRLIALLCGVVLLTLAWSRYRHGSATHCMLRTGSLLRRRRAFLAIVVVALVARVIVAPATMTTDVSQSAMVYAEDLVQRTDWHFTQLDPEYRGAKYDGNSHMHKPPGVYYQYAIPRVLFGFSDIYYRYLTRLAPTLGDLLIAWVLLTVISARRTEELGIASAAFYLLGAGVFATSGILARPDSLAIAFLMLAMVHPTTWRFSVFLGAAVAWKHLALLVTPWFAFRRESFQRLLVAAAVTLLLCAPYLLDDPVFFLKRLTLPQIEKGITGLVWLENLTWLGWTPEAIAATSRVLTIGFMISLCVLPWFTRPDVWGTIAITFALFVVCAKNVHEHYILWSIPAMLITYATTQRVTILIAIMVATLSMAFHHEGQREIGNDIAVIWSALLALSYAIAAAQMIWDSRTGQSKTLETPLD